MRFSEFEAAHRSAQDLLRSFEGAVDWPGLTAHDRAYALPVDWQGEEYTAIVRVHALHAHESCQVPVSIWHWHWRESKEGDLNELTAGQLAAVTDIKSTVRRWIDGKIDELPPSTCRHLRESGVS